MKRIALFALLLSNLLVYAQPANDNCANAINLAVDAGLSCGQSTLNASLEGSECYTNYAGGSTEVSMWYTFTPSDDSTVLNFVQTNTSDCFPHISVYGPFAVATCQPLCATSVYSALSSGDPGAHILLTGLTPGLVYMIQIQGNECGGPNDTETDFCIGVANASPNGTSDGATLIDECGTAFNETTDGGYWQSGTGTGFANLDNNGATQCGTCAAGLDVPFVINNAAWNTFCALTNGTWQITVDNITNCALTGAGIQAAVFTGTTGSLNLEGSQSPVAGSWSSPVITVNAGECAFLMIDGFAGDVCDYTVTLTNITGGCTILPIELVAFEVQRENETTLISWRVKSEIETEGYLIQGSHDGKNYEELDFVPSKKSNYNEVKYNIEQSTSTFKYFKLIQVKEDGQERMLAVKYLKETSRELALNCSPNPAREILYITPENYSQKVPMKFELINLQNQTIWSQTTEALGNFQLSLDDLKSGQYILRFTHNGQVINKKILID